MATRTQTAAGEQSPARSRGRRWWRIPLILVLFLLVAVLALGLWPSAPDAPGALAASRPGPQADAPTAPATPGTPQTINVAAGGSIQAALDGAHAGDTILVPSGTYHESLTIKTYGVT